MEHTVRVYDPQGKAQDTVHPSNAAAFDAAWAKALDHDGVVRVLDDEGAVVAYFTRCADEPGACDVEFIEDVL